MGLIGIISDINTIMGAGATIEGFINPPESLEDIAAQLLIDIKAVFLEDLADDAITTAAANLQAVQDFLSINYATDVANKYKPAQLFHDLDVSNSAPQLSAFLATIETIKHWANEFDASSSNIKQQIGCKAITFCITSFYYLALIYKERSKVYYFENGTPEDIQNGKNSEWQIMQQYALLGYKTLSPILAALYKARFDSIHLKEIYDSENHCGATVFQDVYTGFCFNINTQNYREDRDGMWFPADVIDNSARINAFFNSYKDVLNHRTKSPDDFRYMETYVEAIGALAVDIYTSEGEATGLTFGDFYLDSLAVLSSLSAMAILPNPYTVNITETILI